MNNKVSIIVPCYNQAEYLSETLDSVLAQTYSNWECVIVDDGSNDNSREISQKYVNKDCRFKYIYQENQGPSVARNNGIRHSDGYYILPLDADDLIADTYVEKALDVFERMPDVKLVYCQAKMFGERNEFWDLPEYEYQEIIWENMIFCTAMFSRHDFDKAGGYNPNMKDGLEDWDFWLSFLSPDDKVFRINEILFFYRIKSGSRNVQALNIEKELLRRLYHNHKDIYVSYLQDIIWYNRMIKSHELDCQKRILEKELEKEKEVRSSKAYRLGKFLLQPLIWIRNLKE